MFKPKKLLHEKGFTLTEVMVAILITSVFVATAMQAMVIAAVMKVKARQYSVATNWMQEDLEGVRFTASQLGELTSDAAAGSNSIFLSHVNTLAVSDLLTIGSESHSIQSISGNTVTLNSALSNSFAAGTKVLPINKCDPDNDQEGFAHYLRKNLPDVPLQVSTNIGEKTIAGSLYRLERDGPEEGDTSVRPNINNDKPFEVMKIKYEVKPDDGGTTIARMYAEVIPDVAYQCP